MFSFTSKGKIFSSETPVVMGILNITPDSFYESHGDRNVDEVLELAEKMIRDGAFILDVGGQSSRPGSIAISPEEEMKRVLPVIETLAMHFPGTLISVDTWYTAVAIEAVAAGAGMVNDISGGHLSEDMIDAVASLHVPYIGMHMKGTPGTMQQQSDYENILAEMLDYFFGLVEKCRLAGIHDLILDPGFGFAKNISQNFFLLRHLDVFNITGKPLLAGLSRKSSIYKTLGGSPAEALNGTTVMHTLALQKGAVILRAHDVKEAMETITLFQHYNA